MHQKRSEQSKFHNASTPRLSESVGVGENTCCWLEKRLLVNPFSEKDSPPMDVVMGGPGAGRKRDTDGWLPASAGMMQVACRNALFEGGGAL